MAAASSNSKSSGGSSGGNSLGGMSRSGLVYSIGLERFASRAAQAVTAARPLIQTMQQLSRESDRLSNASGTALQLKTPAIQATAGGLQRVQQQAQGTVSRFASLAGQASLMAARLFTVVSVVAAVSQAKAVLTGKGAGAANALGLAAAAAGVFGGKMSPLAGITSAFVSALNMLPGKLGSFGSKALAAGLGLGVLSGGIGPLSAGLGLVSVGFNGIGGGAGNAVAGIGALIASVGAASLAIPALIAAVTGLAVALVALGPGLTFGVQLAAQAEQSQIAFETMLGSAQQAQQLLGGIRRFAMKTPFQEGELIGAGRSLIAFGESATNIVPALQRIGDISSGIGAPIGEIAELYGKARVQGRLFAQDINQLTNRGIPIIQELAAQFRVTDAEVKKLVESGQVEFRHLEQAFVSLTSAGGRFYGLTEKQSQSLLGKWSTFKDGVSAALREIGQQFVDTGVLQRGMVAGADAVALAVPVFKSLSIELASVAGNLMSIAEGSIQAIKWMKDLADAASELKEKLKVSNVFGTGILEGSAEVTGLKVLADVFGQAAKSIAEYRKQREEAAKAAAPVSGEGMIYSVSIDTQAGQEGIGADAVAERFRKIQELVSRYASPLQRLRSDMREIERELGGTQMMKDLQTAAIDSATGITSTIRGLRNEIDVLSGSATVVQQKVGDLLAMGVDSNLVKEFERLSLQREALQKEQQRSERQKSAAQSIREGLQTPLEKFRSSIMDAKRLQDAGQLTSSELTKYAKQQTKELMDSAPRSELRRNEAATANSASAISAIIEATAGRSSDRQTELQREANSILQSVLDKLGDIYSEQQAGGSLETASVFT